jgi:hypothetical protein
MTAAGMTDPVIADILDFPPADINKYR